jgi:tetratricopeptide (TPR) repeat protein
LEEAERLIENGLKVRRGEISNIEYRLLCAKIYIMNNSNIKRAEFFLKDILKYSPRYDHLSELSLAYLLAKRGKKIEAEKMAVEALKKVLIYAKGDLSTRVWLFYEYFIYAKTMEIVNNREEAVQGYNSCIKCIPNSYLAKLSRKRLAKLL